MPLTPGRESACLLCCSRIVMTPQEFIATWKKANLSERSAAQQHFLDLCDLLGQPKPAHADPDGAWYTFERGVHKTGGGEADVWYKGHFAWEYKRKRRNLLEAYQQLFLELLGKAPDFLVTPLRYCLHSLIKTVILSQ